MMDNEEPWKPPEMQKMSEAPKLSPQVPELTIISTEKKISNTKGNFLQRAMLTEKSLKQGSADQKNIVKFQPVIPEKKFGEPSFGGKSTNILNENNKAYSPDSPVMTKPLVPDLTILDNEESSNNNNNKKQTERVFTNSYKEMMINSHDQFIKQYNRYQNANQLPQNFNSNKMDQIPLARYKQNPLSKYIPNTEANNYNKNSYKDGNSSSILMDVDIPQRNEENDEVTFKKVADMLSEIQKLVIPERSQQSSNTSGGDSSRAKSSNIEILKQLAKIYLTSEELIKYQVDCELCDLEKCQL